MILNTEIFRHSDGNFSAEISELGTPLALQILVEEEPGVQQWYQSHEVKRDREGDVLTWEYIKVGGTTRLTIFND